MNGGALSLILCNSICSENLNPTAFEVEAGLSTEGLMLEEVDSLHTDIKQFAEKQ